MKLILQWFAITAMGWYHNWRVYPKTMTLAIAAMIYLCYAYEWYLWLTIIMHVVSCLLFVIWKSYRELLLFAYDIIREL